MKRALAIVLLVFVGAGLWLRSRDSVEPRSRSGSFVEAGAEEVVDVGSVGDGLGMSSLDDSNEPTSPSAGIGGLDIEAKRDVVASTERRTTRVVAPDGEPIADAVVSWLALTENDRYVEPAWRASDWGPLERDAVLATTDELGRFDLQAPPSGTGFGSVVAVYHPRFSSRLLVLEPGVTRLPDAELVLQPDASLQALVIDDSGAPVAGAVVAHYGIAARGPAGYDKLPSEETARRFLMEEAETDGDGRVQLSPFPGPSVIQARGEGRVSLPWRGTATGTIELLLADAFEVSGDVLLPPLQPEEDDERRIRVQALRSGMWRDLALVRGVSQGAWGPVAVPLLDVELYRARFEGWPFVPAQSVFERPRTGAQVRADLRVQRGVDLWFVVNDEQGAPILNSEAKVFWEEAQPRLHENSYEIRAGEQGWIEFRAIPEGRFRNEVSAPGYATYMSAWFHTSSYGGKTTEVQLARAGELRGIVRDGNEPVADFEIVAWVPDDPSHRIRRQFTDRSDGRFEMADVPVGTVRVAACTDSFPAGNAVSTSVPASGFGQVELELSDTIQGSGRVLDATTLQPVQHATVQAALAGELAELDGFGLPEPVGPDGRFELDGFVEGQSTLIVRAEGYGRQRVSRVSSGRTLAFGDVLIEPTQDLTVRLVGFQDLDPTTVRVGLSGVGSATQPFSPAGIALLPETPPGEATLRLEFPDRPLGFCRADLRAGETWIVDYPMDGRRRLSVSVDAEDEASKAALERAQAIYVSGFAANGREFTTATFFEGPTMEFAGLPIDAGLVRLESTESKLLALAPFDFGSATEASVELSMSPRSFVVAVDVRDGGSPEGITVALRDPDQPSLSWSAETDGQGKAHVLGVPEGEFLADVYHDARGSDLGQPVDARLDRAGLRFDPRGSIELVVRDGDEPLGGVRVDWIDSGGHRSHRRLQSDANARLTIDQVGTGPVRLRVGDARVWPGEHSLHASRDLQVLPVLRRADLDLTVRAPGGLPVVDVPVELHHVQLDTPVEEWIAAGLVVATLPLQTDAEGRLPIAGLARGAYEWRAVAPDGATFEGAFELSASSSEVTIVLE